MNYPQLQSMLQANPLESPEYIERAVNEIKERLDQLNAQGFNQFLTQLFNILRDLIVVNLPVQYFDTSINRSRKTILEIFSRFHNHDALRPVSNEVMNICHRVMNEDNEDNAQIALKILIDIHRTFRSASEPSIIAYFEIVIKTFRNLPQAMRVHMAAAMSPAPATTPPLLPGMSTATATATSASTLTGAFPQPTPLQPIGSTEALLAPSTNLTATAASTSGGPTYFNPTGGVTASATTATTGAGASSGNEPAVTDTITDTSVTTSVVESKPDISLLASASTTEAASTLPTTTEAKVKAPMIRALESCKLAAEYPMLLIIFLNLPNYQKMTQKALPSLINNMLPMLDMSIQAAPNMIESVKEQYKNILTAQVKVLGFLSHLMKVNSDSLRQFEQVVVRCLHSLLLRCPEDMYSLRKEMFSSLKVFVSFEYLRKSLYLHFNDFIEESFLLGPGYDNHRQAYLRVAAYNTLEEFVRNLKDSLNTNQLVRVVHIFIVTLHDLTLPYHIQLMSMRLLIVLTEQITKLPLDSIDTSHYLLILILQAALGKLKSLVEKDIKAALADKSYLSGVDTLLVDSETLFQDLLKQQIAELECAPADANLSYSGVVIEEIENSESTSEMYWIPNHISSDKIEQALKQNLQLKPDALPRNILLSELPTPPVVLKELKGFTKFILQCFKNFINALNQIKMAGTRGNMSLSMELQMRVDSVCNNLFAKEEDRILLIKMFELGYSACSVFFISAPLVNSASPSETTSSSGSTKGEGSSSSSARSATQSSTSSATNNASNSASNNTAVVAAPSPADLQEAQEYIDHITSIFNFFEPNLANHVFTNILPTLFELSLQRSAFYSVCTFLMNPVASNNNLVINASSILDIFLGFLESKLPELGSTVATFAQDIDPQFIMHKQIGLERQKKHMSKDALQSEKKCAMVLKLFRLALYLFKNLEHEKVIKARLVGLVLSCLQYAQTARYATNYYSLLRIIFRVSTAQVSQSNQSNRSEVFCQTLTPLIPTILNALIELHRASPNPFIQTMLLELIVMIPIRFVQLPTGLPLLMPYLVKALQSRTDLPGTVFRILEMWIDSSSTAEFAALLDAQPEQTQKLLAAISEHLKPQPHAFGTAALKLMGKLGAFTQTWTRGYVTQPPVSTSSTELRDPDVTFFDPLKVPLVLSKAKQSAAAGSMSSPGPMSPPTVPNLNLSTSSSSATDATPLPISGNTMAATPAESDAESAILVFDIIQEPVWMAACDVLNSVRESLISISDVEIYTLDHETYPHLTPVFMEETQCPDTLKDLFSEPELSSSQNSTNLDSSEDSFYKFKWSVPIAESALLMDFKHTNSEMQYISNKTFAKLTSDSVEILIQNIHKIIQSDGTWVRLRSLFSDSAKSSVTIISSAKSILERMVYSIVLAACDPKLESTIHSHLSIICSGFASLTLSFAKSDVSSFILDVMDGAILRALSDFPPQVHKQGLWLLETWLNKCADQNPRSIGSPKSQKQKKADKTVVDDDQKSFFHTVLDHVFVAATSKGASLNVDDMYSCLRCVDKLLELIEHDKLRTADYVYSGDLLLNILSLSISNSPMKFREGFDSDIESVLTKSLHVITSKWDPSLSLSNDLLRDLCLCLFSHSHSSRRVGHFLVEQIALRKSCSVAKLLAPLRDFIDISILKLDLSVNDAATQPSSTIESVSTKAGRKGAKSTKEKDKDTAIATSLASVTIEEQLNLRMKTSCYLCEEGIYEGLSMLLSTAPEPCRYVNTTLWTYFTQSIVNVEQDIIRLDEVAAASPSGSITISPVNVDYNIASNYSRLYYNVDCSESLGGMFPFQIGSYIQKILSWLSMSQSVFQNLFGIVNGSDSDAKKRALELANSDASKEQIAKVLHILLLITVKFHFPILQQSAASTLERVLELCTSNVGTSEVVYLLSHASIKSEIDTFLNCFYDNRYLTPSLCHTVNIIQKFVNKPLPQVQISKFTSIGDKLYEVMKSLCENPDSVIKSLPLITGEEVHLCSSLSQLFTYLPKVDENASNESNVPSESGPESASSSSTSPSKLQQNVISQFLDLVAMAVRFEFSKSQFKLGFFRQLQFAPAVAQFVMAHKTTCYSIFFSSIQMSRFETLAILKQIILSSDSTCVALVENLKTPDVLKLVIDNVLAPGFAITDDSTLLASGLGKFQSISPLAYLLGLVSLPVPPVTSPITVPAMAPSNVTTMSPNPTNAAPAAETGNNGTGNLTKPAANIGFVGSANPNSNLLFKNHYHKYNTPSSGRNRAYSNLSDMGVSSSTPTTAPAAAATSSSTAVTNNASSATATATASLPTGMASSSSVDTSLGLDPMLNQFSYLSRSSALAASALNSAAAFGQIEEELMQATLLSWKYLKYLIQKAPAILKSNEELFSTALRHFKSTYRFCVSRDNHMVLASFPSHNVVRQHKKLKVLCELLIFTPPDHPEYETLLLDIVSVLTIQYSLVDYGFVASFIKSALLSFTLTQKKSILLRAFKYIADAHFTVEWKVKVLNHFVTPILYETFQGNGVVTEAAEKAALCDADLIAVLRKELLGDVLDSTNSLAPSISDHSMDVESSTVDDSKTAAAALNNPSSIVPSTQVTDALRIAKLKVVILLVTHVGSEFIPKKKELKVLEHIWNSFYKTEDAFIKSWGCIAICAFFAKFESPVKLVMHIYTALLRTYSVENRELTKTSIDIIVPILQTRLASSSDRFSFSKAWSATKRVLHEEMHNVNNFMHILQVITRHPDVFYAYKQHLASQMINAIAKFGLQPQLQTEHRVSTLNVLDVILGWEIYRRKRLRFRKSPAAGATAGASSAVNPSLPPGSIPTTASVQAGSLTTDDIPSTSAATAMTRRTASEEDAEAMTIDPAVAGNSTGLTISVGNEDVLGNNPSSVGSNANRIRSFSYSEAALTASQQQAQNRNIREIIRESDNMILPVVPVQISLNFLVRMALLLVDTKDPQLARLVPRCVELFKRYVRTFSVDGVKVSGLEKLLNPLPNQPTQSNQNVPPAPSNTINENAVVIYLDLTLSSFKCFGGSHNLLLQCLSQGQNILQVAFQSENAKIQSLFRMLTKRLFQTFPPNMQLLPYELKQLDFYTNLKSVIDSSINIPDSNSSNSSQIISEMKRISYALCILEDIISIYPSWLANHAHQIYKAVHLLASDHVMKASKSSSRVTDVAFSIVQSSDVGPDWSTIPSQLFASSFILSEFSTPFHSLNYIRNFATMHTRSFQSPDHLTVTCLLVSILCKGLHSNQTKYLGEKTIGLLCWLLEGSDSPALLNLVAEICDSWILRHNSPLTDEEQYVLYGKITSYADRDIRDKLNVWENFSHSYGLRYAYLSHRIGNLCSSRQDVFRKRFEVSMKITKVNPYGLVSLLSPVSWTRDYAFARVSRTFGKGIFDRIGKFFSYDWSCVSHRHLIMLLPTLFLLSNQDVSDDEPKKKTVASSIENLSESARKRARFSTPAKDNTAASSNDMMDVELEEIATDAEASRLQLRDLITKISFLSLTHPTLAENLIDQFVKQMWTALDSASRDKIVSSTQNFLLKNRPKKFLYWPNDLPGRSGNQNIPQSLLKTMLKLEPIPQFSIDFLGAMAVSYNMSSSILRVIEGLLFASVRDVESAKLVLNSSQPFTRRLVEVYFSLIDNLQNKEEQLSTLRLKAIQSRTSQYLSYEYYDRFEEAQSGYLAALKSTCESSLADRQSPATVTTPPSEVNASDLQLWQNRWVETCKELSQWSTLLEFATGQQIIDLAFESAAMRCDWENLRKLRQLPVSIALLERGTILVKFADTMLAVIDNKSQDVERNCAQSVQLALNLWQSLPSLSAGSHGHKSLMSAFHRIIELRESAPVSSELYKCAKEKKLPDLKGVLKTWRNRIPTDAVGTTLIAPILEWRLTIFSAIKNAFHSYEANQSVALHDTPWILLTMAKVARKRGLFESSLVPQGRLRSATFDIPSAFTKIREQVLYCLSPKGRDYIGGINIINSTNLDYFPPDLKVELLRLKGVCYRQQKSLNEALQCFSQCVQIHSTFARGWLSWSHACYDAYVQYQQNPAFTCSLGSKYQAAVGVIVCLLKAIENDSKPAKMLLKRLYWILLSETNEKNAIDLSNIVVKNGANISAEVWLPMFHHFIMFEHARIFLPILTKVALAYPQAVVYKLLALQDFLVMNATKSSHDKTSSTDSACDNSAATTIPDSILTAMKNHGLSDLVSKAKTLVAYIRDETILSPENKLYLRLVMLCEAIVRDESIPFENDVSAQYQQHFVFMLSKYWDESDTSSVSDGFSTELRTAVQAAVSDEFPRKNFESALKNVSFGQIFSSIRSLLDKLAPLKCDRLADSQRLYAVATGSSHSSQFHVTELEVPGFYHTTSNAAAVHTNTELHPRLSKVVILSQPFVLQSASDGLRCDSLTFEVALVDVSGMSHSFVYERVVDFNSETLYAADTATVALGGEAEDLLRTIDWSMNQYTISRRRDLCVGSVPASVNIGTDGRLVSNRDHMMSLQQCYENADSTTNSFRKTQCTARQLFDAASDVTAGKSLAFQQLSSAVPKTLIEKTITPVNASYSHLYVSRKHFASQLGVQMAVNIARGSDYPSPHQFHFSSSGHVQCTAPTKYEKSNLLAKLSGLDVDESVKNRMIEMISSVHSNGITFEQESAIESSQDGSKVETKVKIEKDAMVVDSSSSLSLQDAYSNSRYLRLSPSVTSFLSYPLLFGTTLMTTGCTLDALNSHLDVMEAELCMLHAQELKSIFFSSLWREEVAKYLLLSPPEVDSTTTATPVSKKVKLEASTKRAEADHPSSSRSLIQLVHLLAALLAKESIVRVRTLAPCCSQDHSKSATGAASDTQNKIYVNEWDPVWLWSHGQSSLAVTASNSNQATVVARPVDQQLFTLVGTSMSSSVLESQKICFGTWL